MSKGKPLDVYSKTLGRWRFPRSGEARVDKTKRSAMVMTNIPEEKKGIEPAIVYHILNLLSIIICLANIPAATCDGMGLGRDLLFLMPERWAFPCRARGSHRKPPAEDVMRP